MSVSAIMMVRDIDQGSGSGQAPAALAGRGACRGDTRRDGRPGGPQQRGGNSSSTDGGVPTWCAITCSIPRGPASR